MKIDSYSFGKVFTAPFLSTVQKVREALAREGFGILTEIDVRSKFTEKLGKDFRNYLILGACNPAMAYEALNREVNLGTLLPCNVVVYTRDDGMTAVTVMNPIAVMSLVGDPEIAEIATLVAEKLQRVLSALETET